MAQQPDRSRIGANVRRLRTAAGLNQSELAEKADIADATLSRIERNRLVPSIMLAERLATALGVKIDALLAEAPSKPPQPRVRRQEARLLALVRDLDEAQIDDIVRAIKLLLAVGRRSSR